MKFQKPAFLSLRLRVFLYLFCAALSSCAPDPSPGRTIPRPPQTMPSQDYLGLSKEEASAKATAARLRSRVIRIDDQHAKVTKDHRPERLNFEIESGKVVRVTKG